MTAFDLVASTCCSRLLPQEAPVKSAEKRKLLCFAKSLQMLVILAVHMHTQQDKALRVLMQSRLLCSNYLIRMLLRPWCCTTTCSARAHASLQAHVLDFGSAIVQEQNHLVEHVHSPQAFLRLHLQCRADVSELR